MAVGSLQIITTVATRCQNLRLKCTDIDFGWRFAEREGKAVVGKGKKKRGEKGEERRKEGNGGTFVCSVYLKIFLRIAYVFVWKTVPHCDGV